jgi:hypothetical protein
MGLRIQPTGSLVINGYCEVSLHILSRRPPLWSIGQSSWLQTQRFRVPFPALPDFLDSNVSGTGSSRPCEDK